ncbi:hypothetical protein Taro_039244 [Colocasia esculenta]|uniref:Uncharacterized protein n=1 Tax=Colocasia esculenta TaxID=4460 RepID=A0A843WV50_COLES|nr:hypothetical protein [Colocasia esculenta]
MHLASPQTHASLLLVSPSDGDGAIGRRAMDGARKWLRRLVWMLAALGTAAVNCSSGSDALLHRSCFPEDFIFGSATSAYQVEGAVREDGRGPSIWDVFTHRQPGKIDDRSNGDVAVDFYHRYKEDLRLVKEMGLDAFRFSIAWSRIFPNGKGEINRKGIRYYNNLIDEILSNGPRSPACCSRTPGLLPFVTIFHWDTPQSLEDEYGGFLSPSIVDDFRDFAEVCFREFGDRVKHWATFNEPDTFSTRGYATGGFAPGRCSPWEEGKCSFGDSGSEPYIVGHHILLAHAAAVKLYREKYQDSQQGGIGITLTPVWAVPLTHSESDVEAASRALDFMFGWFMDPLAHGEYPMSMRSLVGDRLPEFTNEQAEVLRRSFDFVGINYYTGSYVQAAPPSDRLSYTTDSRAAFAGERNGIPLGPLAPMKDFYIYPEGLRELLLYIKNKYNDPAIFVTENGVCQINNSSLTLEEALADDLRVYYYHGHLVQLLEAIR